MGEVVQMARRLGERVGRELDIPVYLYEEAATRPERTTWRTFAVGSMKGSKRRSQRTRNGSRTLAHPGSDPPGPPLSGRAIH